MKLNRRLDGYTLTELLVVLVIIGILVLIALPNLMPVVTKAKATEAKVQLEHLHNLEKAYFMEYSKYSSNLSEIGFEQEKLSTDGGNANYRIDISSSGGGFEGRATAVVDFDGDGTLNVWTIDQDKNLREEVAD